ncbi:site-specific integrase [Rathayibacter sp. AY1E6]|nr:site-specific integrase [Rathayibacter sp. AY1E6]
MARRANGEETVYRRTDGRWEASFSYTDPQSGKPRRASSYGRTRAAALEARTAKQARLAAGQPMRDAPSLLGAYTEEWIDSTLRASDRKLSTRETYAAVARTWIVRGPLSGIPLARLTARDVERWLVHMDDHGRSASSMRQTYSILRSVLDTAVRDGLLAANVAALVKRPAARRYEARALTTPEATALLDAGDSGRYGDLFRLIAYTGMRRGEALALRWEDVDALEDVLFVRGTLSRAGGQLIRTEPKTARSRRRIPLSAPARAALRAQRVRQAGDRAAFGDAWKDHGLVFAAELGGPAEPGNVSRAFRTAAAKSGFDGSVGLHALRHSAATLMLIAGVPLTEVSRVLGHSSIAITADVYGHPTAESQRVAVDALAGAYSV